MQEQSNFKIAVLQVLKTQLEHYPLLSLIDIYKSFFQDTFGPGHLLVDAEIARTHFTQELKTMKSRGRKAPEFCGMGTHFCRIPMDLVLDGVLDEEIYFSAFFAGASAFSVPDVLVWKKTWDAIHKTLKPKSENIHNFFDDSKRINEALEKGIYAMSHSSQYRTEYEPHYRIFTIEQQRILYSQIQD
ncbi:MAG: hypothetical protein ACQ5SW_13620 [Sphaerochaetaceae bacterium]